MSEKLSELVEALMISVKGAVEKFNKVKPEKWSVKSFVAVLPELTALVKELVTAVEKVSKEVKDVSGGDKKEAVMSVLTAMLDSGTIKVPFVPKWLVKKLLGLMVDWVVAYYNEKFGKGQGEKPDTDWVEEPTFHVLSVR